jgi:hypothetical protein
MSWLGSLDVLHQDAAYAWRAINRTPGFTALVVVTLTLGIGVNAATFTLLDRLYLRPPGGVSDPLTLRRIWVEHFNTEDGVPYPSTPMNYPMFRAIASAAPSPERLAVFITDDRLRQGPERAAPKIRGVYASANYFGVLGLRAERGRFFTDDEDRFGHGARVAVVRHHFWRTRLGADPAAVGRMIRIGTQQHTIIGVLPPSFTGLDHQAYDVWMPLATLQPPQWLQGPWWESPSIYWHRSVQRIEPGDNIAAFEQRASVALRDVNRRLYPFHPDTQMNVLTGSIVEARGPGKPGQELIISTRLGAVSAIVLIIAWANVVNLLLASRPRRSSSPPLPGRRPCSRDGGAATCCGLSCCPRSSGSIRRSIGASRSLPSWLRWYPVSSPAWFPRCKRAIRN